MGDQFERFIQNNRDAFQKDEPSDKLWQNIEDKLSSGKNNNYTNLWKVAAMILLVLSAGLIIDKFYNQSIAENKLDQEFQQAEAFYTSIIDQKRKEIEGYDKSQMSKEFLAEVDKLDSMYVELKKTFTKEVADEKVVNAMINNLQIRIELLNQQLLILKKLKQHQNENIQEI